MRHEDIALAASSARSYTRHWRAHGLSWNTIGKIRYLMDGAIEYMDEVTLCYPQGMFNKLRTVLGFKQDSELAEMIEEAGCFDIVKRKDTGEMVAFMTPLVPSRYVPTDNEVIAKAALKCHVFEAKANALYNRKNTDKIGENLRVHKKGINMKMLLKENAPAFHAKANLGAYIRLDFIYANLWNNQETFVEYFGEFIYHYQEKYKKDAQTAKLALRTLIQKKLMDHMACRVDIEHWPEEAILTWIRNYFGAKRLPIVITEAREILLKNQKKEESERQKQ